MNLKNLAEQVAVAVKAMVKSQFELFEKRLAAVEVRPTPEKGEPGDKGPPGNDGSAGLSAFDLAAASGFKGSVPEWVASLKGPQGADGKAGADGVGKDGPAGKDGATAFEIAQRAGFKGNEAEWLLSLRGAQGADGKAGDNGAPGSDGKDGIGIAGKDGGNGKDGEPGRDALTLDVLPGIDESRSYIPRTYASHNGGLFVARRKEKGIAAWDCIVDGVAGISIEQTGERTFRVNVARSSGAIESKEFTVPSVIDKGVFREGTKYQAGDAVSWGGSLWVCQKETSAKPGDNNSDFRLAVKRGRDGKDKP